MTRVVVTDTGPVLHLKEASGLEILSVYDEVLVPPLVEAELVRFGIRIADLPNGKAVRGEPLTEEISALVARRRIHAAEAEAIVTAEFLGARLLTDDLAARRTASQRGLEVRGVFGVVLEAVARGSIPPPQASQWINRIAQTSLYVSPKVLEEAHRAIKSLSSGSTE